MPRPEYEIRQELTRVEGIVRRLRKQLRKKKREKLGLGLKRKGQGSRENQAQHAAG